eukprot:2475634-Rhodomonas_salina.1
MMGIVMTGENEQERVSKSLPVSGNEPRKPSGNKWKQVGTIGNEWGRMGDSESGKEWEILGKERVRKAFGRVRTSGNEWERVARGRVGKSGRQWARGEDEQNRVET